MNLILRGRFGRGGRRGKNEPNANAVPPDDGHLPVTDPAVPAIAPRRLRPRGIAALIALVAAVAGGGYALWPTAQGEPIVIAVAGDLLGGEVGASGRAQLDAVRLLVKQVNEAGGINGHPIKVDVHDDHDRADAAQDIAYAVGQRSQAIAVIGHSGSTTSLAAQPIYRRFEIPAVSASATEDSLTSVNGWYYRTIFNDSFQARFIARYARFILEKQEAVIISDATNYGKGLADNLGKAAVDVGINVLRHWPLPAESRGGPSALDEAVAFLQRDGQRAVVFMMAGERAAKDILVALKDKGVSNVIIAPDALGRSSFAERFQDLRREREIPGFYTSGLFVTMPLIYDVASAQALAFRDKFEAAYKYPPPWQAAFAYDAAAMILAGASEKKVQGGVDAVRRERALIRDYLMGLDSQDKGFNGIAGPVYFEGGGGDPKKPISMAMFQNSVITPLSQLTPVANPKTVRDLDGRIDRGDIVRFEDQYMYRNTIAYTGIRPTGAWTIDADHNKFSAEFELWFRYRGDVPAADIVFLNAAGEVTISPATRSYEVNGVNYRLHRVSGSFQLDSLSQGAAYGHRMAAIYFRNRELTSEQLMYLPDGTSMPKGFDALAADLRKTSFLPQGGGWDLNRASLYSDRINASVRGEPELLDVTTERFPFSTYVLSLDLSEEGSAFRRAITIAEPGPIVLSLAVLLLALLIADRFIKHIQFIDDLSLVAISITAFALLYIGEIALVDHWLTKWDRDRVAVVMKALDVVYWLLPAWVISQFFERTVLQGVEAMMGRPLPRLVGTSITALIYIGAFCGIYAFAFHQQITYIAVALGLVVMIVGFAMHRDVANVFSGILLNLERAFVVGDWIAISGHGEGRVMDMSWRATKLRTAEHHVLSIPNSTLSSAVIDRPEALGGETREWIEVMVDPSEDPARVTKVLSDAAMLVRSGESYPGQTEARFLGIDDWSARYRLYFPVGKYENREAALEQVWSRVRAGLNYARVRPEIQGRANPLVNQDALRNVDPRTLLTRVAIFGGFNDEELLRLAGQVRDTRLAKDTTIVRQNDVGDSLFIIVEGVVSVQVQFGDKPGAEVARVGPGDFFGEMALMTGEARTATAITSTEVRVFEITKGAIAPIIAARRELVDTIVTIIDDRQRMNAAAKARSDAEAADARNSLRTRIAAFLFG